MSAIFTSLLKLLIPLLHYFCFIFEHCWNHMDTERSEGDLIKNTFSIHVGLFWWTYWFIQIENNQRIQNNKAKNTVASWTLGEDSTAPQEIQIYNHIISAVQKPLKSPFPIRDQRESLRWAANLYIGGGSVSAQVFSFHFPHRCHQSSHWLMDCLFDPL